MTESAAVAFIAFAVTLGGVALALILTRYYARRLRSQEVIRALEMGQDLPLEKPKLRSFISDLRTGVLLITFSVGFSLFMLFAGGDEMVGLALIPFFLGIGFLINAALLRRYGPDNGEGAPPAAVRRSRPPHDDAPMTADPGAIEHD